MTNNDKVIATATQIRKMLFVLTRLMARELEEQIKRHGLRISGLQYGVLRVLYHHHITTLSELSHHMDLTPATLVPVVDALERDRLLERNRDPKDRRRTLLSLTANGLDILDKIPFIDRHNAFVDSIEKMGAERSEQLVLLLRELADHMIASDEKLAQCMPWHRAIPDDNTSTEDDAD